MFQKKSITVPSDFTGILRVCVIQTRRCSAKKHAKICKFLRVVIRDSLPTLVRWRKRKTRALTIRTQHYHKRNDGLVYQFQDNALVLLKRRMNTVSKNILGPTSLDLKIKKFRVGFSKVF